MSDKNIFLHFFFWLVLAQAKLLRDAVQKEGKCKTTQRCFTEKYSIVLKIC